jgi:hypothetical protein
MKKRPSLAGVNNPFFGKAHTAEFKRRQSENRGRVEKMKRSAAWWYALRRGKSVEELYGDAKGQEIRQTRSLKNRGSNNPSFGKVYDNGGGRGLIGKYKGRLFRSAYEYSFYKAMEQQGRLQDVRYEGVRIPYTLKGTERTYAPDFLVGGSELYEIKSKWHLEQSRDMNEAKFAAAEDFCTARGWTFCVLTEDNFFVYSRAYIRNDPDVVLSTRASPREP